MNHITSKLKNKLEPWQDPKAKPYIKIESVSKVFDDGVTVVDNISLMVYRGELFSLLGESGCGKTTLLRMLAGFETPSAGKIYIDGIDMTNIPPYERPVNMMFQSYALFPHMTVEENVAFGLRQENIRNKEIQDRVEEMLELVKMASMRRRKPHQLSGGQCQRVALARSLIKQPKLLLLDEPLAALDRKLREQTQFELVNIQERVGITFIMVTHDQEEAMTMSTRVGVMDDGRIRQVGTPTEIYEYPNSQYVADFIGSINLFEGVVVEDEPDHVLIHSPQAACDLYVSHAASTPVGAQVAVAVRPEKIMMTTSSMMEMRNCTKGTVEEIAYLGDVSIYHVRLESGKVVLATLPNLVRVAERPVSWGDEVYLYWKAENGVVLTS